MRKLILSVAVSLDGFIEGPNGEYDWILMDSETNPMEFFNRIDSLFVGRKTYEMAEAMGGDSPPGFPAFKEYIFSTTLKEVKAGAILINENVKEEIEKIKMEDGRDIWLFGGAGLTTSLLNMGLVDEISLAINPILLGAGKPLFYGINGSIKLTLIDSKSYKNGLVGLTYRLN